MKTQKSYELFDDGFFRIYSNQSFIIILFIDQSIYRFVSIPIHGLITNDNQTSLDQLLILQLLRSYLLILLWELLSCKKKHLQTNEVSFVRQLSTLISDKTHAGIHFPYFCNLSVNVYFSSLLRGSLVFNTRNSFIMNCKLSFWKHWV